MTEADGFAIEHALQIGFDVGNDDMTIFTITQENLLKVMNVLRSGECVESLIVNPKEVAPE